MTGRRAASAASRMEFAAALVAALALAAPVALADPASRGDPGAADARTHEKATQEEQLRGVEDTIRASDEQRRKLEGEVETVRADRARLSAALIETTAKVQDSERAIALAGDRLAALGANAEALSRSLDGRRAVIADVLAALQRMGAHPPPAILVKPQDMAEAVRAATMLGSVIPDLESETEALVHDLDDLAVTKAAIGREREAMETRAADLGREKARLALLVEARQKSLAEAEGALGAQRERAAELARQATTLKDLIGRLDSEIASARAGEAAAEAADANAAADVAARAAAARAGDSQRLKPQLAFAEAKGRLALPAAGSILKTFGAPDAYGGAEKGVSLATPAGATVSAPTDGSVVFSGAYRSYGQLLIINAGGGYYMALAGMVRINVSSGQFVLAGEPVGVMGDRTARTAAATAIGAAEPVLYIELRKDGAAIDPGPWWMKADIEKARG